MRKKFFSSSRSYANRNSKFTMSFSQHAPRRVTSLYESFLTHGNFNAATIVLLLMK